MPLLLYIILLFHPFFLAVTEAEYDAQQKSIGISCKLFNDDLENALKKMSGQPVDILNGNKEQNQRFIRQYFDTHFRMSAQNKTIPYTLLGYEQENDVIYVFLEAKNVPALRQLQFDIRLLHDQSTSQINLVHFRKNGKRESQRLTFPDSKAVFSW